MNIVRFVSSARFASLAMLGVTIVTQVLQIPIVLLSVGTHYLGIFAIAGAVPALLATADFGLFGVSSTRLLLLTGESSRQRATGILSTMISLYFWLVLAALLVVCSILFYFRDGGGLSPSDASLFLQLTLILSIFSLLLLFSSLWECYSRGVGRHIVTWRYIALFRFLDFWALSTILLLTHSLVLGSMAMLGSRLFSTVFITSNLIKSLNGTKFRMTFSPLPIFKGQLNSNFGSFFQVSGYWMSTQGMTLAIGLSFGTSGAALYSSMKTFLGGIRQFSQAILNSEMPIVTRGHVALNQNANRMLFRKTQFQVISISLSAAALFAFCGPFAYSYWTGDKISITSAMIPLFSLASFLEVCFLTISLWTVTQNKHLKIMSYYFVYLLVGITLTVLFRLEVELVAVLLSVIYLALTVQGEINFRKGKSGSGKSQV